MEALNSSKTKRVALLGFSTENQSVYRYLSTRKFEFHIFDEKENTQAQKLAPETTLTVSPAERWELDSYDMLVRSPGLSLNKIKSRMPTTSATQMFFEACPAPIVGVTGTKGKGTTATLINNILSESGLKTHLLGNIGKPALDSLDKVSAGDVVVYELSSFQLWDLNISPHIAVVLMIRPEHLDVHADFQEYIDAKSNITRYQLQDDMVFYHPTDEHSAQIAKNGSGRKYKYLSDEAANIVNDKLVIDGVEVMPVSEFGLPGPHNHENIAAALSATWQFTTDAKAARRAIAKFKGLEHRLESVRELDGVKYFNDSFATVPEATIAAVKSFSDPEILILGGSDKKSDYSDLANVISSSSNIKKVILIGEMAPVIQKALDEAGFKDYEIVKSDIESIVSIARSMSERGDVVLLSPACASFDMFDNYKQRGKLFKNAVRKL